jgi:hypothetical protein
MSEREWCTVCGDVGHCMHRPNVIIRRAWWAETYRRVRQKRKKEKDEDR